MIKATVEVMLISPTVDEASLFESLRLVMIDGIHAITGGGNHGTPEKSSPSAALY